MTPTTDGAADKAEIPTVTLGPGEGAVFASPARVEILLQCCVAVTFHCPDTSVGAVLHALFPKPRGTVTEPCICVETGVDALCLDLAKSGLSLSSVEAKVFGGANSAACSTTPGRSNAEAAFRALERNGVRVAAANVGGHRSRRVVFFPHTGEARMTLLDQDRTEEVPVL